MFVDSSGFVIAPRRWRAQREAEDGALGFEFHVFVLIRWLQANTFANAAARRFFVRLVFMAYFAPLRVRLNGRKRIEQETS
jgi:hypothetical protein